MKICDMISNYQTILQNRFEKENRVFILLFLNGSLNKKCISLALELEISCWNSSWRGFPFLSLLYTMYRLTFPLYFLSILFFPLYLENFVAGRGVNGSTCVYFEALLSETSHSFRSPSTWTASFKKRQSFFKAKNQLKWKNIQHRLRHKTQKRLKTKNDVSV